MKALVTGSHGFVGEHLRKLLDVVDFHEATEILDLRDEKATRSAVALKDFDFVVHLAAQSFVPRSFENPRETLEVNFLGTLNLLNALEAKKFEGKFLFIGSGDMYGSVREQCLPISEDQPLKPKNPYAVSKVAAEALCYQWSQTANFEILMARPFNHIGPGQNDRFVVSSLAKQLVEIKFGSRPATLFVGDLTPSRDFTDVRDVVRAYLLLLKFGENGGIYNVCSGEEVVLNNLLQQMIQISGVDAKVEVDPLRLRASDQVRVVGDSSLIKTTTGWKPEFTLEQSLKDLLNFWEKQLT